MLKKILILTLFMGILSETTIFAENNTESENKDSNIISSNQTKDYYIMTSISYLAHALHIQDNGGEEKLIFLPNNKLAFDLAISYKNFSLSYQYQIPVLTAYDDTATYGETKYRNIIFNYYLDRIGIDILYQNYKGYYLKNMYAINPNLLPKRNDLQTKNRGANIYYNFRYKNFQLDKSFDYKSLPTKGDFGILLMFSPSYFEFTSEGSLIPPNLDLEEIYHSDQGLYAGKFYNLGVMPGIGGVSVHNKSKVAMSFFIGPIFQRQKYYTSRGTTEKYYTGLGMDLKGHVIFYGGNFFSGFKFQASFSEYYLEYSTVFNAVFNVGIFLGYMF